VIGQRCAYLCMTDLWKGEMVFTVIASDMEMPMQCAGMSFESYNIMELSERINIYFFFEFY